MTHTQIRFPLSALFLAVASLAGCGGDSSSPPTPGVAKTAQTITFTQPAAVTVGGGTSTLAATSTSSLVVAFASTTPSICTVSGTTLTPVSAGNCTVTADQAGDATFEAAPTLSRTLAVNPAQGLLPQVITFNSPGTQTVGVSPPALVASSDSSLPVTLTSTTTGICTVSGTTLALVSGGTCSIDATQAGDSTHAAATKVTVSFAVNAGSLPPSTTVVNFEETTTPSLAGFGGAENSTVIVDPTNAANKVVAIVKAAAAATYAGTTVSTCPGVQSVGTIPVTSTNSRMSLKVWSPTVGKIRLKVEDSANNTHSVETEATVTTPGAWETLTFDFKTPTTPPTAAVDYTFTYNKATIFPMFGAAGTGSDVTYYFDDLIFPGVTYTPSASCPTPPPPPAVPATAATAPSVAAGNVISLFSDTYTNVTGTDFFPAWSQATVVSEISVGGSAIKKMTSLNYEGIVLASNLNVSGPGMTSVHVDIWTADASSIKLFLISPGPVQFGYTITPTASQWTSVDIPLSAFSGGGVDLTNVFQLMFVGVTPASGSTVYYDNLYFKK